MRMLAEDELREAVLLIFANKQDLPNAMNAAEITDKLGLHSLRNRNWYIQVRVKQFLSFLQILVNFDNYLGNLRDIWRWSVRRVRLVE